MNTFLMNPVYDYFNFVIQYNILKFIHDGYSSDFIYWFKKFCDKLICRFEATGTFEMFSFEKVSF